MTDSVKDAALRLIERMAESVAAGRDPPAAARNLQGTATTGPCEDWSMSGSDSTGTPNGPWLRHSRRTAYENPWLTIWHDEVSRPDGSPGIYGVVHFANVAVGVVAIDEEDRVCLVRQHRYPLDEPSWEIPEGGVPPDEAPLDGMRRELREETGVEAAEWRELGRLHLSNSVTDEAGFIYLARGLRQGSADPEPTEQIDVQWVPFDEALAMALDGRITDALSIIGLQRVALDRLAARSSEV
jgi:8-oxo-dGTP pyrophosphatase MutT (NUDIX family)